ncbi:MAG: hypothetical protein ACRDTH_28395 [Pseudonocardiaceae bacterium]
MNTGQERYEDHEPPEGGRVRHVPGSEGRVGAQTGYPDQPDLARPAGARHSEPATPDAGAPGYVEHRATTASDNPVGDGGVERMGLLNDVARLRDEWQRVQGTFVDDPPRAVHEASVLVDRTLDEIRMNVGSGPTSERASTEDLRVTFQRYREFFQRLLSA